MKLKKSVRGILAAGFICAMPATTFASGIPVIDIASVTQAVTDYTNQLLHYEELMQQTVLNQSQLVEAVNLYEQTMVDYDHMLRQMEGLKSRIDKRQWQQIYAKYGHVINSYPGMKPDFNSGRWTKTNRDLEGLYSRADDMGDIESAIDALGFDPDSYSRVTESARQSYAREQLAVGQHMFVEDMSSELEFQMERYGDVAAKRRSLGAEDHLATMQVMTEQNELLIEALHQQNAINNAQLQYSNQLDAHYFSKNNIGRSATLNEAKARRDRAIDVENGPLVGF